MVVCCYAECRYAEFHGAKCGTHVQIQNVANNPYMLSVIILNFIMLSVVAPHIFTQHHEFMINCKLSQILPSSHGIFLCCLLVV